MSDWPLTRGESLEKPRERFGPGTRPPGQRGMTCGFEDRRRLGGDGRDRDRRAQDHQAPSPPVGKVQSSRRCGRDKQRAPQPCASASSAPGACQAITPATRAGVAGQIVRSTRCRDVHEHVAALLSRDVRGFKTPWAFQQPCIYLQSRTAAAGARTPALRSRPSIGGTAA